MDDILYKEYILELYRNPLHKKKIHNPSAVGEAVNTSCGDSITIMLRVDEGGVVCDAGHQGFGCAISQAAVSLLLDWCIGKSLSDVMTLDQSEVVEMLGIHVSYARKNCATLGHKALCRAIKKYEQ